MAAPNNNNNPPQPDLNVINNALIALNNVLGVIQPQVALFANVQAAQNNQQAVLDQLDAIVAEQAATRAGIANLGAELAATRADIANLGAELRKKLNREIRLNNAQRHVQDPATPLLPLASVRTRAPIPNSPATAADIAQLSSEESGRILVELGIDPPPRRTDQRRAAVRQHYL